MLLRAVRVLPPAFAAAVAADAPAVASAFSDSLTTRATDAAGGGGGGGGGGMASSPTGGDGGSPTHAGAVGLDVVRSGARALDGLLRALPGALAGLPGGAGALAGGVRVLAALLAALES